MKKLLIVFISVALAAFIISFKMVSSKIVGNWSAKDEKGHVTTIRFSDNGKFLAKIPAEHFIVAGQYRVDNKTLSLSDTSCNKAYWGKYAMDFHGNDSVYLHVIADTCKGRRLDADNSLLVRDRR